MAITKIKIHFSDVTTITITNDRLSFEEFAKMVIEDNFYWSKSKSGVPYLLINRDKILFIEEVKE